MSVAKGIRAGRAFVELATDDSKLQAGLKAAQARLMAFGKGVSAVGAGLFAAGAAASTAFAGAAKVFSDQGDAIAKMARRTGLTTEAVSELGYAADLAGTDAATLETGIRKMQIAISDAANGAKPAIETLDRLGLSVSQLAGLTPDAQLEILADRLAAIADPATRAALAQDLFGKSGTQLIPLLQDGSAGLRAMRQEAVALGLSVGGKTAENAEMLNDAIGRLSKTLSAVVFNIGASVGPMLADLADRTAVVVSGVVKWIKENPQLVTTALQVSAAVAGIGATLVVVGGVIVAFGAVISGVVSIISAVTAAAGFVVGAVGAITLPFVVAAAAIGGLVVMLGAAGVAFWHFTGLADKVATAVGEVLGDIGNTFSTTIDGVMDALQAGDVQLAVDVFWAGFELAWIRGQSAIESVFRKFIQNIYSNITYMRLFVQNEVGRALKLLGQLASVSNPAGGQALVNVGEMLKRDAGRKGVQLFQQQQVFNAANAASDADAKQRLDEAEALLYYARDAAKRAREAADARNRQRSPGRDPLDMPPSPELPTPQQLSQMAQEAMAQARSSAATTFSSTNLSGLGVGDENARKTAEATAETARTAKGIKDLIMQNGGGMAFA